MFNNDLTESMSGTACMIIIMLVLPLCVALAEERTVFFREDFNTLDEWEPLYFDNIDAHSQYAIEADNDSKYLKATSKKSASGLVFKKQFNVYSYSKARWRWKVSNVYKKGNAKIKKGDDYPLRIYIIFKYDPKKASFGEKIKYSAAKLVYGEYPPHSGLNYIWANKQHEEKYITNTYTDKAEMIVLQEGNENVGKWVTEEVNIIDDYKKAFGTSPPDTASIAVMNDSDDTGEESTSYLDFIEVYK